MSDNTIVSVFGRKGSGKTTLTRDMVADYPRVVVVDPMHEYHELEAATVCYGLRGALAAIVELADEPAFTIVAQELDVDDGVRLLGVLWELPDSLVVVEEASLYASAGIMPDEIARLARFGRHRSISQMYVSQRPADVPRLVTAQSDLVVSFRQHEDRDVRYLRSVFGREADELRELGPYEVKVYGDLEKAPLALLSRVAGKRRLPRLRAVE